MATKVYVVYYSMYGHVEKLAEEIKKGADSVEGVEATLWQMDRSLEKANAKYMVEGRGPFVEAW